LKQKSSYSRGVTVQFRNEEESRAFHCAFKQWKEEVLEGAALKICSPLPPFHWFEIDDQIK